MKKKSLRLSVHQPCDKSWEQMESAQNGKHCTSCEKNVVDFTQMSDRGIITFLTKNRDVTCGRFLESQVDREISAPISEDRHYWQKLTLPGLVLAASLLSSQDVRGQVNDSNETTSYFDSLLPDSLGLQIISGFCADSSKSIIPRANIVLLKNGNSVAQAYSDSTGFFRLRYLEGEADVMVIYASGYLPLETSLFPGVQTYILSPVAVNATFKVSDKPPVLLGFFAPSEPAKKPSKRKS